MGSTTKITTTKTTTTTTILMGFDTIEINLVIFYYSLRIFSGIDVEEVEKHIAY